MAAPSKPLEPRLVDSRNRVYLPVEVMQALGVKSGDYLVFQVDGKEVRLHRATWSVGR